MFYNSVDDIFEKENTELFFQYQIETIKNKTKSKRCDEKIFLCNFQIFH